jgi:hypothetical protein
MGLATCGRAFGFQHYVECFNSLVCVSFEQGRLNCTQAFSLNWGLECQNSITGSVEMLLVPATSRASLDRPNFSIIDTVCCFVGLYVWFSFVCLSVFLRSLHKVHEISSYELFSDYQRSSLLPSLMMETETFSETLVCNAILARLITRKRSTTLNRREGFKSYLPWVVSRLFHRPT